MNFLQSSQSPVAVVLEEHDPIADEAPGRADSEVSRGQRVRAQIISGLTVGASIVGGLVVWQLVAISGVVDNVFFPRLTTVLGDLRDLFTSGDVWPHLRVSGQEYAIGMIGAIVIGVAFGVAIGMSKLIDRVLSPWVYALYAVPRIALVPILIVWFGIGIWSKVATVFIMAVFPIVLNTAVGVKTVDRRLLVMAEAFMVSPTRRLRAVILPSSVPYMLTGVRVGVANGLIGVVVGEFFGAQAGIGFLLNVASYQFNSVRIFSVVVILAVFGVLLTTASGVLERRVDSWRNV